MRPLKLHLDACDSLILAFLKIAHGMHYLGRLAALLALTTLSIAVPQSNDRHLQRRSVEDAIPATDSTSEINYETMPAGTYTEAISNGVVRIIIVAKPTTTTASDGECPEECDCSDIEDKQSDEYFQCVTNPDCRFCGEDSRTTTTSAKPTPTCPVYCDCSKIKNKESDE
ncbi:hypothetical protein ACJ41O_011993 [Fusarium nematophilum]